MEVVKGQMAELTRRNEDENTGWEYIVVKYVYDDRIHFLKQHGGSLMYILTDDENETELYEDQPTKIHVNLLFKNKQPVMSKKTLFGKYKFEPKIK